MKRPIIELSDCIVCHLCVDVCPSAFRLSESGFIEIIDLEIYPEEDVDEAIKNCPEDCIEWEMV